MDKDKIRRTVMFVDDEINILNSLRRGLHKEEYNQIFVSSAKEALEKLEKNEIEVLVTDMRMPEMNGLELLKLVEEKYPDIVKIVLSGYTQLPQILATVNQVNIFKFITKPWNLEDEFKRIINESIDFYNMRSDNVRLRTSIEKKNLLYQKLLQINDEKLKSNKSDSLVIKNCLEVILKYSKEHIVSINDIEDKKSSLQNINFMDEIMSEVISVLPSSYKYFEFEYIKSDLNNILKANNDILDKYGEKEFLDSKVELIPLENLNLTEYKFYSMYKPLVSILKIILTKMYTSRFDDEFYINIKEEKLKLDDFKFIFIISSRRNKIIREKLKQDFLLEILNSFIQYYFGKIIISKNQEKDIVILEIHLSSSQNI